MARARRPRPSKPSPRTRRSTPSKASASDALVFENVLRDAVRDALEDPVSELTDTLLRIADRLSGSPESRQLLSRLGGGEEAEAPAPEQAPEAPAPEQKPCAVIGCPNPPRSLGYCAAHYQKRRLMIASNRLHPLWVENPEPNSLPDVIPPRRPRGERQRLAAEAPTPAARPVVEPRVIIRKKGAAPAGTADKGAEAAPQQNEHAQVASTVERWAQEFKARNR